ncbi:hypothetical protein AAF712_014654, partial [Marasmius tenuissimus]
MATNAPSKGWLPKPIRQRLFEPDHDAIWLFHTQNPTARHADIARHFDVSRTTVSKLLKKLSIDRPIVDFNQILPSHGGTGFVTVPAPDTRLEVDIFDAALSDVDADQTNFELNIHEERFDLNELLDLESEALKGQSSSIRG